MSLSRPSPARCAGAGTRPFQLRLAARAGTLHRAACDDRLRGTDRNRLIAVVSKFLYPEGRFNADVPRKLEIAVRDPAGGADARPARRFPV